jgi:hypothetical protein
VQNLKKILEEGYKLLIELIPGNHTLTYFDIEVDTLVKKIPLLSALEIIRIHKTTAQDLLCQKIIAQ